LSPFAEGKEDGGYKPERQVELEKIRGDAIEEEDEEVPAAPTRKPEKDGDEDEDEDDDEDEGYDHGKELEKLKKNKK